jgi:hypothetical protein
MGFSLAPLRRIILLQLLQRRSFLKAISVILPASQIFRFLPAWGSNSALAPLINTLRSLKNPVCMEAADLLESQFQRENLYVLHLRHGMLSEPDAKIIGGSLKLLHQNHNIRLKSLSVSYNPKIGSEGAAAILIALPKHIEELGMVGCDLDDRTGSHLIRFIKQSKYLKMVCVEENNFSQKMRAKIKNLRKQQSKCTIIV